MTRPKVSKADHQNVLVQHEKIVEECQIMLDHYTGKKYQESCNFCHVYRYEKPDLNDCLGCPWLVYEGMMCEKWMKRNFTDGFRNAPIVRDYKNDNFRKDSDFKRYAEEWVPLRIKMLKKWISKSKKQIRYRIKKLEELR